jgi:hypothetical protein
MPNADRLPPFHFLTHGASETNWSRFDWLEGYFGSKEVTQSLVKAIRSALSRRA